MAFKKLQVRRNTAASWTTDNPTLSSGEIGFETDTRRFKFGDGSTAWASLGYSGEGGSSDTAAQILAKLITVDGAASGLDADLLDGQHAAAFALSGHSHTKLDFLTVTQAVDLDAIETRVNALDAAVVLKGAWAANAGTFPGGGTAQAGDSYIVSVAGTVGGIAFAVNDRVLAIVDNASTGTYANNWLKLDYTDQVLSVNGLTGAVDLSGTYQPLDADTLKSDVSANLTAGFSATQHNLGTISSGTVTPAFANGNEQKYTNNGAHTLAPATLTAGRATSITVEITNGASAGAITTSGFTKVTGDPFTTTNGHKFKCFIHIGDAGSLLNVVALQ